MPVALPKPVANGTMKMDIPFYIFHGARLPPIPKSLVINSNKKYRISEITILNH